MLMQQKVIAVTLVRTRIAYLALSLVGSLVDTSARSCITASDEGLISVHLEEPRE